MAESVLGDLIDGASGDEMRVATLLRKVKIVAARVETPVLEEWVEHELNGYPTEGPLPDYRARHDVEVRGDFTGPYGSSMTAALIPPSSIVPKTSVDLSDLFAMEWREPISEIESFLRPDGDTVQAQWPADAVSYVNGLINRGEVRLYEGMYLVSAYRLLSGPAIAALIDRVRTRILDLALALEGVSPNVGGVELAATDRDQAQSVVFNMFGGSANIALGPDAIQTANAVMVGDREGLFEALQALGVGSRELVSLETALDADTGQPGLGPRVREWLGERAVEAASAGGKSAAAETAKLVARAVASYFGLAT